MQAMSDFLPQELDRPFRGILFDLDGTLIDSEGAHYRAFAQAMQEHGYDFDSVAKEFSYEGSFRTLYTKVAERLGLDQNMFDTIYARKMELTMVKPAEQSEKVEGILSFLELLLEQSVPMAVVTNSDRAYAEAALTDHELDQYFQHIITANDIENFKPHPEGYLRAAELLGLEPETILVFENTESGIAAAKAAGMPVVAVRGTDIIDENSYDEADHVIDSFDDPTLNILQFDVWYLHLW